jgi:putative phosphoribosyl transferase
MTVGLHPVLADLLTPEEQDSDIKKSEDNMQFLGIVLNKFNIQLFSSRLTAITKWIIGNNGLGSSAAGLEVKDISIGYFGASTGAATAVQSSVSHPYSSRIYVIVTRGGGLI